MSLLKRTVRKLTAQAVNAIYQPLEIVPTVPDITGAGGGSSPVTPEVKEKQKMNLIYVGGAIALAIVGYFIFKK